MTTSRPASLTSRGDVARPEFEAREPATRSDLTITVDDRDSSRERSTTAEIFVEPVLPRGAVSDRRHVTLLVAGPNSPGSLHVVTEPMTTIGRSTTNAIAIADAGVSGLHARLVRIEGVYVLEDLESRNGTYVNGLRVARQVLVDGDRIQIGRSAQISVRYVDESELEATKKLYDSAVRDPLTGIFNRRYLQERLLGEWAFALRHRTLLAMVMIDVDHFKKINDLYGHLGGDEVLRSVAAALASQVRAEDLVARYGGEEFAVLARAIDVDQAQAFAERLRKVVEALRIPLRATPIAITASFGVAVVDQSGRISDPPGLIGAADDALYQAKRLGRNRVVVSR